MKKLLRLMALGLLLCGLCRVDAHAIENNMLKVGIKYGGDAMFSANLQNYEGMGLGYALGYYDAGRAFVPLGPSTAENKITMVIDGNAYVSGGVYYQTKPANVGVSIGGWHLQLNGRFERYEDAASAALAYEGGYVAYLADGYAVRVGQYLSQDDAAAALGAWSDPYYTASVASPSSTGVIVTVTGTNRILFGFDCGGLRSLGVQPLSISGEKTVTWFRGYRYNGGFEYQRVTGGSMNVVNVVDIEDYVKGVVPYEIGSDKPSEALKAQAVCARTYAANQTRHRSQGFDVCTTTDCQVYQGVAARNELTDEAVEETAGQYLYYDGKLAGETYYYSSNGGASEDAKNVWGGEVAYLKGKADPYEAYVASRISSYNWTVSYTKSELSARLRDRGYDVGTVNKVYVSEFTPNGNVYAVTIEGTGGSRTVYRETCRTLFGLRSMRFTTGGDSASYYINGASDPIRGIRGVYTISGSGTVAQYNAGAADTYVVTSSGISVLQKDADTAAGTFVFTGSGWGHNVGLSQWGATAMAELGCSYREILEFYYSGATVQ